MPTMLRKLFSLIPQSKKAPPSSPHKSPQSKDAPPSCPHHSPQSKDALPPLSPLRLPAAPQVQEPRDSDAVDVVDMWASLPIDLILQIVLRLEPAAIVFCAGVCKPWRRAIIANASILGPHLDRFLSPKLLLGVFHCDKTTWCLWRTPGPFQSALPWNGGMGNDETPANSLIPAAMSAALPTLLSSGDGFILLRARSANSLCLCNPVTGYCRIIPVAAGRRNKYILLTGSSDGGNPAPMVRILAVHRMSDLGIMTFEADREILAYQLLSTSGDMACMWGPIVQCSGDELEAGSLCVLLDHRSTVIGTDAVYWLAGPRHKVKCVFALDVRTGRTWTTELPWQCHVSSRTLTRFILSMSGDGQLSFIEPVWGPYISVWALSSYRGGARWNWQRTIPIDVHSLLPDCPPPPLPPLGSSCYGDIHLSAFCPRSRCVVALLSDQELLVDIESDDHPRVRKIGTGMGHECWPYEMDCSATYISKMKHF